MGVNKRGGGQRAGGGGKSASWGFTGKVGEATPLVCECPGGTGAPYSN